MKQTVTFTETYSYSMSHTLPTFPDGHKCRRAHGHLCDVTITVCGRSGPGGYWIDHARLDAVARETIGLLDHRYINDIKGLERGLAEDQLNWLVARISESVDKIGGSLLEVHHDEWSSGSTLRRVVHRKTWRRDGNAIGSSTVQPA